MYFGMFGSVFLLVAVLPARAGPEPVRGRPARLPWTAMPIFVAPIAGVPQRPHRRPADRLAGMVLLPLGLAWLAAIVTPTVAVLALVPAVRRQRRRHGHVLRADRQRRPVGRAAATRRARRRAPTTRSARSAASSASPSWRRSFSANGSYASGRPTSTASSRRSGSARSSWPSRPSRRSPSPVVARSGGDLRR